MGTLSVEPRQQRQSAIHQLYNLLGVGHSKSERQHTSVPPYSLSFIPVYSSPWERVIADGKLGEPFQAQGARARREIEAKVAESLNMQKQLPAHRLALLRRTMGLPSAQV